MERGETHFTGRVAQKALVVREGKVLLVRTIGEKNFALPGGRLNEGETPEDGLLREVEEEIGCRVTLSRPFSTGTWISPKGDPHFLVVYLAHLPAGAELVLAENEIEEAVFVGKGEYDELNLYPEYRKTLDLFFEEGTSI